MTTILLVLALGMGIGCGLTLLWISYGIKKEMERMEREYDRWLRLFNPRKELIQ